MTPKEIKAMKHALDEKHAVESAMQQAFTEKKPKAEVDEAIRQWNEKNKIYNEMGEKFFHRWPVEPIP